MQKVETKQINLTNEVKTNHNFKAAKAAGSFIGAT